jgi:transposase
VSKPAIDVITSVERRRRWSRAEKERLVAASLERDLNREAFAHEYGINRAYLSGVERQSALVALSWKTSQSRRTL